MDVVKLKNGAEEAKPAVQATMMSLSGLWDSGIHGMTLVYDLNLICQGKPAGVKQEAINELKKLNLLQGDGRVHDTIKNIVLSAVSPDGMTMKSPIANS